MFGFWVSFSYQLADLQVFGWISSSFATVLVLTWKTYVSCDQREESFTKTFFSTWRTTNLLKDMKPRPKLKHRLRETSNSTVSMKLWSQLLLSFLGATADWVLRQPPCDLTSTVTGFYKRKYALAVANQSPLRDKINEALIELQFSNKFEVGVESRTSQRGMPIPNRDCCPPTYYSARSPPPPNYTQIKKIELGVRPKFVCVDPLLCLDGEQSLKEILYTFVVRNIALDT